MNKIEDNQSCSQGQANMAEPEDTPIQNLLEIRKRLLDSPILPAQKKLFNTPFKTPTCSTAKISDSDIKIANKGTSLS